MTYLGHDAAEGVYRGVENVHERLRTMILNGKLAPGAPVSQDRLARDLGVSRTPLREALRMLQREGLLEAQSNRRLHVAGFSVMDLEQLYIMRITLEATAVRLTIPRLTSEEIAGMEGNLAQMEHFAEEEDFERWEVPHRAFHRTLVGRAGRRIDTSLSQLSDHAERYRRFHMSQRPEAFWRVVAREHRLILDTAKSRDVEMGARRLAAHLARTAFAVAALVTELADSPYRAEALDEVLERLVGPEDPWQDAM